MDRFIQPTDEQRQLWAAFVKSRPANVRSVVERFFPWQLYRLKPTGQIVYIVSFDEHEDGNVTLRVAVTGQFNCVVFNCGVFDINLDDLEICDAPLPNVVTCTFLTDTETVHVFLDHLRSYNRN